MKRALVALLGLAGCVEALPGDDRLDAGTTYLRLLRPRTGATVFARRPRLRWFRSDATVDARIELCADRACTRLLQAIDATGGTTQVPAELPTGVVFWRVRPRRGSVVAAWGSPTGWFVVARGAHDDDRADSIDARPRLQIDVDGDGHADVVLPDGTIYRSEGAGFERSPYGRLLYSNGQGAVTAGDLNGDGFLDLAVADPTGRPGGVVHVYDGPLARGVVAPRRQLTGTEGVTRTLSYLDNWADAPAGDVNGDGYDDLMITSTRYDASNRVHLFLGGASGVAYEPAQTFESPLPNPSGFTADALADLDGDGYDEALLASPSMLPFSRSFVAPVVFVHRGSPSGLESPPRWVLRTLLPSGMGAAGVLADVDGSGHGTAVLHHPNALGGQCMVLFRDPLDRVDETPGEALGCEESGRSIGWQLEAGDVDGDGRADVIASVRGGFERFAPVGVRVYRAPRERGGVWQATTLDVAPGAEAGVRRFGLGDLDGDGVMDGITWVQSPTGPTAYVHRGGAAGLATTSERVGL